jgi:hypothetical protein
MDQANPQRLRLLPGGALLVLGLQILDPVG